MKRFSRNRTLGRARWRPFAWATAALVAAGITAGFATAASAQPGPAAGVAPGAANIGGGEFVFYTAGDGSVWQKQATTTPPVTSVGGRLVSAPSPIFNGSRFVVFGQGTDRALWTTTCGAGGGCGAWTSLGGVLTSKPGAVFVNSPSIVESVYARGTDGALWARDLTITGWNNWHSLGGALLSGTGPSAALRSGGQFVLVVGTDRHLYLLRVGGPGFDPVGGTTTASPAITNTTSGLVGYATGTDGAGWTQDLTAVSGWRSLGGFFTSGFAAANDGANNPYGFALGGNSQVWMNSNTTANVWTQVTP
jgi:hypothetical protein